MRSLYVEYKEKSIVIIINKNIFTIKTVLVVSRIPYLIFGDLIDCVNRSLCTLSGNYKYWIFDMDGTLTIPQHDFDEVCKRLDIPAGSQILEYIQSLPTEDQATAQKYLKNGNWKLLNKLWWLMMQFLFYNIFMNIMPRWQFSREISKN